MSMRGLGLCLLCCVGQAGCLTDRPSADSSFMHLFFRNTLEGPREFVDDQWFKFKAEQHAKTAWDEFSDGCSDGRYADDFREGFLEGYVDYLDAGGNGRPPAVPPERYWKTKYQTPQGIQAVQDWFAGFRLGAAAARASGYRESIVVPLSASVDRVATPASAVETAPVPNPVPTEPGPMH